MFKKYLLSTLSLLSKILRKTPLRKIEWIANIHMILFGLLSTSTRYKLADFQLEIDPRDRTIAKKIALYGDYEGFMRDVLLSFAAVNTTVVDIGANIGLHTIPLSKKVGSHGKIIAFEPDPDNYHLLLKNISLNDLKNVTTHNIGLSNKAGDALLFQSTVNRGGLSICENNIDKQENQPEPVKIELSTADTFLTECVHEISLIKIDVEGAEPLVIEGMLETLKKNTKAVIVFEFSPAYIKNFGVQPSEFLSSLIQNRYELSIVDENSESIMLSNVDEIIRLGNQSDNALNLIAQRKS